MGSAAQTGDAGSSAPHNPMAHNPIPPSHAVIRKFQDTMQDTMVDPYYLRISIGRIIDGGC
jgi:hypothetical protein